jgi:hypothetical protein
MNGSEAEPTGSLAQMAGARRVTSHRALDAILAQNNPDCGGDTNCVCMPASCL